MAISKSTRLLIHKKYDCHCSYCGLSIELKEMQVDHIVPKIEFSKHIINNFRIPKFLNHLLITDVNHLDNLNPSCAVCNKWKNNNDLEFFRMEIKAQVNRLNKYSSNYRMAKKYNLIEEKEHEINFYFEAFL